MLGNDLVINENACNLGCKYCLTGQSNLKLSHESKLIFQPPTIDSYIMNEGLGKRLHAIVDRVAETLAPPLLKLTGGEIFLIRGIIEFIEKIAPRYEVVIVQTNGLPLTDDKIGRLVALGNVTIQISLDSSKYEGNIYRTTSRSIHKRILDRVAMVANSGLPLEIYSVLTDRSVPFICDFLEWCNKFRSNPPQLFPFPVRGPDCDAFSVRPDQHHYISRMSAMLPQFAHVLPPKPYVDRLTKFYLEGIRSWRCHLPRLVMSTFDDGVLTPCPNIWFHKMGDITGNNSEKILSQVGATSFYELLLGERPRLNACKGCFTPWDTLSLYFDSLITLDELCRAPSYASPGIRRLLAEKKAEYLGQ